MIDIALLVIIAVITWAGWREIERLKSKVKALDDALRSRQSDARREVTAELVEGWKKTLAGLHKDSPKRELYEKALRDAGYGN